MEAKFRDGFLPRTCRSFLFGIEPEHRFFVTHQAASEDGVGGWEWNSECPATIRKRDFYSPDSRLNVTWAHTAGFVLGLLVVPGFLGFKLKLLHVLYRFGVMALRTKGQSAAIRRSKFIITGFENSFRIECWSLRPRHILQKYLDPPHGRRRTVRLAHA